MTDIVSIIVSVCVIIVLIGVSIYLYIMYCHPQDKGIGVSIPPKILIILAQALAWGQLLIIPLDVSIATNVQPETLNIIYNVVYWTMLFTSILIIPFAIFVYQSSQSDSWVSRIVWSLVFALAISLIFLAIIFVSYIWLGVASVTVNQVTIEKRIDPGIYVMICLSFVGWILLIVNGGIGIIYLPLDLINYFVKRPKPVSSQDAYEKKKLLQAKSEKLVQNGQILKNKLAEYNKKIEQKGFFQKRKEQAELKSSLESYKTQVDALEEQHQIFGKELNLSKNHPLVYWVSLFFGILTGLFSLVWCIQLGGTTIYKNKQPAFPFIDTFLVDLSAGPVNFLAVAIYSGMVLYMLLCAIKGNIVFGVRIPYVISVHTMKLNKTYLHSFLFNVNLMMLYSLAISQLSVNVFGNYLKLTYINAVYVFIIYNLPMFGFVYSNRIFPGALCVVILIVLIFAIVKIILANIKKDKQQQDQNKEQQQIQLSQSEAPRTPENGESV